MEPLRDIVVALTLSDGCSADTQMSVEYLMVVALILQNLMVAPTVTLVRSIGDTVVAQGYPSIPTVSQCDYSIAACPITYVTSGTTKRYCRNARVS